MTTSGGFDLGALLEQAQAMQQQLAEAQQSVAEQVVTGQAGGGAVRVDVTGAMEFQKVTIDRSIVDPDETELLEDLVLAALHDAVAKVQEMSEDAMGGAMGGLGGVFGGALGLGDDDGEPDEYDEDEDDDDLGGGGGAGARVIDVEGSDAPGAEGAAGGPRPSA